MNDRRLEELARRLLDTPASEWPSDLAAMRVPARPMPDQLRSKLAAMHSPARDNVIPFVRTLRFRITAAASIGTAVAAAALLFVRPMFWNTPSQSALLTFSSGDVQQGGRRLTAPQTLKESEPVEVGAQSVAVIALEEDDYRAQIRVQAESSISIQAVRAEIFDTRLYRGNVMASLERKNAQRGMTISSPAAVASVRGTKFSLEVDSQNTRLSTYEGSVAFRRRLASLEELPEEVIARSRVLLASREILLKASATVPAGSESSVGDLDVEARLGRVVRLKAALTDPLVSRLRNRRDAPEHEVEQALRRLEEVFQTEAEQASVISSVEMEFGQAPEVRPVLADELTLRQAALEALSEAERDARYKELQASSQNMDRETFKREAARVLGKAPQEIILKSGETIYGSVFGENDRYKIYTNSGIRMIDVEQVEEIRFE